MSSSTCSCWRYELFQGKPIHRQRRTLRHPAPHLFERNLQQLRAEPGGRLRILGEENLDLLLFRVDLIVALILVVPERGEVRHLVLELTDIVAQLQRRQQVRRAAGERALKRRELGDLGIELRVGRLPLLPAGEDVREIPLERRRDVGTFPLRGRSGSFGRREQVHPAMILQHPRALMRASMPPVRRTS